MDASIRDYYYYPEKTRWADLVLCLKSTPKDFGQYLQNKRKRKKK